MELQGKTALVTGGAKRIGRAIALSLAEEGMDLILHYRNSHKEARQTKEEAEREGVKVCLIQADLNRSSGVNRLIREAYRLSPRIDLLINNASVFYKTPLGRVREKDWEELINVNLKAPFFLAQTIGLGMFRKKQGKIINLIDWTAFRPRRHYLPYCVSKAALVALTQGLAKELAPHVQVNGIAPGPILPAQGSTPAENRRVILRTPLGRLGRAEDIVEAVRFLAKATDFVTGTILPVDGGNLIA
jgi:NAD(P)-dependent dehydrogenase (short-subunit alcohol dehydrogenase family)